MLTWANNVPEQHFLKQAQKSFCLVLNKCMERETVFFFYRCLSDDAAEATANVKKVIQTECSQLPETILKIKYKNTSI